jgi:hypothetical protein
MNCLSVKIYRTLSQSPFLLPLNPLSYELVKEENLNIKSFKAWLGSEKKVQPRT